MSDTCPERCQRPNSRQSQGNSPFRSRQSDCSLSRSLSTVHIHTDPYIAGTDAAPKPHWYYQDSIKIITNPLHSYSITSSLLKEVTLLTNKASDGHTAVLQMSRLQPSKEPRPSQSRQTLECRQTPSPSASTGISSSKSFKFGNSKEPLNQPVKLLYPMTAPPNLPRPIQSGWATQVQAPLLHV